MARGRVQLTGAGQFLQAVSCLGAAAHGQGPGSGLLTVHTLSPCCRLRHLSLLCSAFGFHTSALQCRSSCHVHQCWALPMPRWRLPTL